MSLAAWGTAVLLTCVVASGGAAQESLPPPGTRLDPATRAEVERVIEAARADGVPVEPLVNKALEGASKGAAAPRVAAAVRALAGHLRAARAVLGSAAADQEIAVGAEALRAGATADDLRTLRRVSSARPLTVPLTILSDLVGRGVPADTASAVVAALAARGAPDREYLDLRHAVERDIDAGLPPGAAAALRARAGPPPGVPARAGPPDRRPRPARP